jgi:nucleoid-associated protein YejK
MKLNRLIIHEVIKNEIKLNTATVELSQSLLTITQNEVNFVEHLNKRYIDSRQSHGCFKTEKSDSFANEYLKYKKSPKNNEFLNFSKSTTGELMRILNLTAPAKGGFLVYAEYEDYGSFVAVFLIRNRKGSKLIKSDNVYTITEQIHVDVDNLAMACRINTKRLDNKEDNYLSFINKKSEDSKFFLTWICANEIIRDKDDTKALISLLRKVTPPKINGVDMSLIDLCDSIYDHIRSSPKREVSLEDIGLSFWEDSAYLLQESNKHGVVISSIFKPDNTELKKLVDLKATADSISISFPQELLNDIITVKGDKIVIKSQSLADKINSEKIY